MAYPAASLALIDGLSHVAGLSLPTGNLGDEAAVARNQLDTIIAGNPEHAGMVETLEREADQQARSGPLPSGDDLAAELERYLRDQGGETGPGPGP
jgi:hypothetical protein